MYLRSVPPRSPPAISRTQLTILELILGVPFTLPPILLQLPYESVKGNPVPTVIFKGLPSIFQGFLVSVTLAFTRAFNTLMLNDQSRLTTGFRYLSMPSMASAVIVLVWALSIGEQPSASGWHTDEFQIWASADLYSVQEMKELGCLVPKLAPNV